MRSMPDSEQNVISLKEHLLGKISELKSWFLITLEQYQKATEKALELQAKEYERRLDSLNHAHDQAIQDKTLLLPREIFEAFLKEFQQYKETTSRALILREGEKQGSLDLKSLSMFILVGIATILSIASYFRK